jgi:DNA-binding NarL/FixJ family response regulator
MGPKTGAAPVRIFLVGLSEGLARSLARYVSSDPRVALVGVVPSLALASMLLTGTRPDLTVLDWTALNGSTPYAVSALRLDRPEMRIILATEETEPYREAAAAAGADAVIAKDTFAEELEPLLRRFFPERFGDEENGGA